jgi:hypothetical protein
MTPDFDLKRVRIIAVEQELSTLRVQYDWAMSAFKFDEAREAQKRIVTLEREQAELAKALPATPPPPPTAAIKVMIRPRRPGPRRR